MEFLLGIFLIGIVILIIFFYSFPTSARNQGEDTWNKWINQHNENPKKFYQLTKEEKESTHHNAVDGKAVPVPHFGVVLEWNDFEAFADKLKHKNIQFVIEPYIRFEGLPGEQATMFFYDPCGNALEFKSFKDLSQLFAK